MKVAYLLGSLNRGGTETLLLDIFKQAPNTGFELMGFYRKKGGLLKDFVDSGQTLIHLKPRFIIDPVYYFRLRKQLKYSRVDIVHAQQAIDALYAWIATRGIRIKLVLTLHGYNFKNKKLLNIITWFIINKTNLNIYVSRSQMNEYWKRYDIKNKDAQRVIYNGISFERIENENIKSIKKEFGIEENTLLLGSVGNFNKVRDQMTICRFLNLLNKSSYRDFAFIFAGARDLNHPDLFDKCQSYCESNGLTNKVFFPGSRTDVPNILNQLDFFIYASNHDTFGIAVIEAMAAGVPVFVNDWEVMLEITDNGQHAVVYKSQNEQDLLDKFVGYIKKASKHTVSKGQDIKWAKSRFGIMTTINSLEKEYHSLLK